MKVLKRLQIVAVLTAISTLPSLAQTTREKVAELVKPMHDANLRTIAEYNCNMALINMDRSNILDRMNGKAVPQARYDAIITKATECIGTIGNSLAYAYRANAFADKGDTKNALPDFEKAISVSKAETSRVVKLNDIYEDRAELYIRLGDRAKADADLREAVRLDPSDYTAKEKLDNLDRKLADARKAAALANPQTAADYVIVGNEHLVRIRDEQAILAFDKSIALSPSSDAYLGKGKALRGLNRPDAALVELNRAHALAPKDVVVLQFRGYVYLESKRFDEAIADFTKALAGVEKNQIAGLYSARGRAQTGNNAFALAIKDYESALASAGDNEYAKIDALAGKGDVLQKQGKRAEAIVAYDAAIAAAGNNYIAKLNLPDTYLGRGRVYASQGKTELAKADFNEALKIAPDFKDAKAELAKLSGAATPITPVKTAEQWAREGQRAGEAKKFDEAVNAFSQCITLVPAGPACYAFRGAVLGLKGDLERGLADFDKAFSLNKTEPAIYFIRGQMYAQLGKKPEAVADFRTVLKIAPGNPQATKALELLGEQP